MMQRTIVLSVPEVIDPKILVPLCYMADNVDINYDENDGEGLFDASFDYTIKLTYSDDAVLEDIENYLVVFTVGKYVDTYYISFDPKELVGDEHAS